jgi:hypothetical protein
MQFSAYHRGVGARIIRRRDDSVRQRQARQENLTLLKLVAALTIPMLLALALVAMDMRNDLDELKSSGRTDDKGAIAIGWPELAHLEGQRRVRMLGYMMDGHRSTPDGESVNMFILLPEAGQFLHPAHRIPNRMVEVWPAHPIAFRYRELVWTSGMVTRTIGNRRDDKAAYAMSDAEVTPASERDIGKWFSP